jgi:hypothetical protein
VGGSEGRLAFWRCSTTFEGRPSRLQARRPRTRLLPTKATEKSYVVDGMPLGRRSWEGWKLPPEDARSAAVVSGLPSFPKLHRSDGTFLRPAGWWAHSLGRDAAIHPPRSALR